MRSIKVFVSLCSLVYMSTLFSLVQAPLKDIGSLSWVQEKMNTYPELGWLLDEKVSGTQEGLSKCSPTSWSYQLVGAHHPEFERTLLTLVCFELIMNGSQDAYKRFVAPQPSNDTLTWENFKKLHNFAVKVIGKNQERFRALEYNLVLGDMGKTTIARTAAKILDPPITVPDQDQFLEACLKQAPFMFPSFSHQPLATQHLIRRVAGLIHFGHTHHAEGGPTMLTRLKTSNIMATHPADFDFEVLTHICDISGARGHESNQGSQVLTNKTWEAFFEVKEALHFLKNHTTTEALTRYLDRRAAWLGLPKGQKNRLLLARVGAMARLFNREEGRALQKGFEALSPSDKILVEKEWAPLTRRHEQTPTYIPAVLVNYIASYEKAGHTRLEAIENCVKTVLPMIAQILAHFRMGQTELPYTIKNTLEFNKVAGQIREQPSLGHAGSSAPFTVDPQTSQVTLVEKGLIP